jgi:hypothetical protein
MLQMIFVAFDSTAAACPAPNFAWAYSSACRRARFCSHIDVAVFMQKVADGKRIEIQNAVMLLQYGLSVFSLKAAEARQRTTAQNIGRKIEEEADVFSEEHRKMRRQMRADFAKAEETAQHYADAAAAQRRELHMLTSRQLDQQHIEQLGEHKITQVLVEAGFDENREAHGQTHGKLEIVLSKVERWDELFAQLKVEGNKVQVSSTTPE